ncbi:hypothetical protein AYO20_07344 [Fonsecaea nubica]|uniref:Transcription factor domain-containing protein n=1 Tax=Fonsecaea nubica TaxID=856822 RepID=A0A178CVZ8_9EURO|nr:hypothetical protein AYO20_07344 [Fonsecaea nubica]OAL33333.1 hypothetical protein AYO20_07344 [Fonsecaea nubica]
MPPTTKQDVTKTFTFLNYDNPDHSASHRRLVKSHISSKYRAAVRQQTQPRYALPHHASKGSEQDSLPKHTHKRTHSSLESQDESPDRPLSRPPSPLEVSFSGTRMDPFKSWPGQETPGVTRALDYYTQAISPLMQPLFLTFNMANPLMVWMYPLILSHGSAYHAAVAMSQAYLEKSQAPSATASSEVTFHRRKAVSILYDQLSHLRGPPDDGVLMTVLALACLDVLYGEDRIANRKGLAMVVALKGGLGNLGLHGLVKAFLVQFDYFWMLETGAQTIFPFRKRKSRRAYPQRPFKDDFLVLLRTLPTGFAAIARQGTFSLDTIRILSRVSTFLQFKTAKLPRSIEEDPVSDGQDYPDLFEVCASLQSSANTENSLEKNLILAVIMLGFDVHNPNASISRVAAYRGSRQELTRSLPFTQAQTPDQRGCLIWIMMIVIRSWGMELPLAPPAVALSRCFFTQFPGATSWDAVESTMRCFFWYNPLTDGLMNSWQHALDAVQKQSTCASVPGVTGIETHNPNSSSRRVMNSGDLSETAGEGATVTLTLPRMLTLDTYLKEVQSL